MRNWAVRSWIPLLTIVALTAALTGVWVWMGARQLHTAQDTSRKMTLYKSPSCGCCGNYTAYLRSHGYTVVVKERTDISSIKEQFGVPPSLQSCHTAVVDGYVIEGHVPYAELAKLLADRPPITGIALPGMPAGAPGMPGIKLGVLRVYSFATTTPPSVFDEF